jgi:hypothetical protein
MKLLKLNWVMFKALYHSVCHKWRDIRWCFVLIGVLIGVLIWSLHVALDATWFEFRACLIVSVT